ncbi:MAG: von Willebrand factor type A domain-containing protein [Thermoanaerobaculia bacterium]|nr:von Willebrand factor type A domain-containing protein [Thermoanaerobaculia bacterium]
MRLDDKNLARNLREVPAPPPPADLLARLKEDLPGALGEPLVAEGKAPASSDEFDGTNQGPSRRSSSSSTWRVFAMAASLVTLIGGGLITYRVLQSPPPLAPASKPDSGTPSKWDNLASDEPLSTLEDREGGTADRLAEPAAPVSPAAKAERLEMTTAERSQKVAAQLQSFEEVEAQERETGSLAVNEASQSNQPSESRSLDKGLGDSQPSSAMADQRLGRTDRQGGPGSGLREEKTLTEPELMSGSRSNEAFGESDADLESEPPVAVDELQALGYLDGAAAPPPATTTPKPSPSRSPAFPRAKEKKQLDAGASTRGVADPAPAEGAVDDARLVQESVAQGSFARDSLFKDYGTNPFVDTDADNRSTFGLDVDTASYTLVRGFLNRGELPPTGAVRVEEMVNAFRYPDLEPPRRGDFALRAEWAPSPWARDARRYLLRLTIKGREATGDRRATDLILVVDTSGSMAREDRLGLVKQALRLLVDELQGDDRVGLVTYGDHGRVLLAPTANRQEVLRAIDALRPDGSTNAEEGLSKAYDLAAETARKGIAQRIILCSDGVANVGRTGPEAILERIGDEARRGVELTTVGFGMGNYNDVLMEQLADRGDGRYAYVDSLEEARRLFVEELTGTLMTLGAEARAQVEMNPDVVARYRLLGYENRDIADHRFRDDSVDAGEIGVGHAVTALYEIVLHPRGLERLEQGGELASLRLRYRPTGSEIFREDQLVVDGSSVVESADAASFGWRLATTVARFAEILRAGDRVHPEELDPWIRSAQRLARERPRDSQVAELAELMTRAKALMSEEP